MNRRRLLQLGLGAAGASLVSPALLAACSSSSTTKSGTSVPPTSATSNGATGFLGSSENQALLAAAQREGSLTTAAIGTPHSYYVPIINDFEKRSKVKLKLKNPTYLPSIEVSDLKSALNEKKPAPYDVVELTPDWASKASEEHVVVANQTTNWTDIPSVYKSTDGTWSAAYFGVVSFITNVTATNGFLPSSWDELASSSKTPKGSFAMLGDPRSGKPLSGGLGILTIFSAALANGGSLDNIGPGIDLLAELANKKIFDPLSKTGLAALPDDAGSPETPINALYSFDVTLAKFSGQVSFTTVKSHAPNDGLVAGYYPQAVAAGARHPKAALLWIEYLQSNEGAMQLLQNGAYPTRYAAIQQTGSKEMQHLFPSEATLNAPTPSLSQITKAQAVIDETWAKKLPAS